MTLVRKFTTGAGREIFSFPVQSFPNLINNIYVIDDGGTLILVDCGSGMETTNSELLKGFEAVSDEYGRNISLGDIDTILISHGHIDHFGGLPFVRQFTDAPIGIHILDRRVLSNHEERVIFASRRLETFLERAGVSDRHRSDLMSIYSFAKNFYRSTPVQFLLEDGKETAGGIGVIHVPGHCPGQVCLLVDDMLLTADHILSYTTPHQAPESITNHMGLGHYLDSLAIIERAENIVLGLGGHEEPMHDVSGRIQEIKALHMERLEKILEICDTPKSTAEISRELFGQVESYHVLLALEEAGAHVEYLYQRGELVAANFDELEHSKQPVVKYARE
jgi:glyoxylase-like metal-dependent hydrolase (beta-lactamase superfamily II)